MVSPISKILIGFVIALALIGFADSTFLQAKRMSGEIIPCLIGTGCDTVSKSEYSVLFGIPLSAYGMMFYLTVGLLALLYLDTKKAIFARLLLPFTAIGFIASVYFIYVQKFLIGAFCLYCVISAIISTILFGIGIIIYRKLNVPSV